MLISQSKLRAFVEYFFFKCSLLARDSFDCHLKDTVKKALKFYTANIGIILRGCDKNIQHSGALWRKLFKVYMAEKYGDGKNILQRASVLTRI